MTHDVTRQEAATLIDQFRQGSVGPHDWDDSMRNSGKHWNRPEIHDSLDLFRQHPLHLNFHFPGTTL